MHVLLAILLYNIITTTTATSVVVVFVVAAAAAAAAVVVVHVCYFSTQCCKKLCFIFLVITVISRIFNPINMKQTNTKISYSALQSLTLMCPKFNAWICIFIIVVIFYYVSKICRQ